MSRLLRGIIYRARFKYIQLSEMLDHYGPKNIDKTNQTNKLPEVKVVQVKDQKQIESLCNFYYKNPSSMMMVPWKKDILQERISNGVKFYLIYNQRNILVGAAGVDPERNMFVHSIVDYKQRKQGYGKSMYLILIGLMKEQGVNEIRAQILKRNIRAKNMLLSIGFEIDPKEDKEKYFTMIKRSDV